MPLNSKSFELTILGCSGGPICGKTCSFLLKPTNITYFDILSKKLNCIIAIDAGTGLSSLIDILNDSFNNTFTTSNYLLNLYNDSLHISEYLNDSNLSISYPFKDLHKLNKSVLQLSGDLFELLSGYLITHSHLDHISGLVINSTFFKNEKLIFGLHKTLDILSNSIFNNLVWPNLSSIDCGLKLIYKTLNPYHLTKLNDYFSVISYQVSHGYIPNLNSNYESTAFLIINNSNNSKLLIFGDVESDLSSLQNLNCQIWDTVSIDILSNLLNTIIIECSSIDKLPNQPLFGHMTPTNLITEFIYLRKKCIDDKLGISDKDESFYKSYTQQPLLGLNVIIIHIKETFELNDPRKLVLNELNKLNDLHNLGICFTIGLPGLSYLL